MSKSNGPNLTEWQADMVSGTLKEISECENMEQLAKIWRNIYTCYEQVWFLKACAPKLSETVKRMKAEQPQRLVIAIDTKAVAYICHSRAAKDGNTMLQQFIDYLKNMRTSLASKYGTSDFIVFFADESEVGSWRSGAHPDWKKERKPNPQGFDEGLAAIRAKLDEPGKKWKRLHFDGYEADDVLASIALTYNAIGDAVLLIAQDRDLYQTLGVYNSMWWSNDLFGRDDLKKKYGLEPRQWVDWLCMVGKNDLPKPYKIADVTAAKLLVTFGSYLNAYDSLVQVRKQFSEVVATSLQEFYYTYPVVRPLHTLNRTLEIPVV